MLVIPAKAIFDLQAMVIMQLARWLEISKTLGREDNLPEDFDPNDIPIYLDILRELLKSDYRRDLEYPYPNKQLWFMIMLIPDYIEKNMQKMSFETYMALKEVYDAVGGWQNIRLPEWPNVPEKI